MSIVNKVRQRQSNCPHCQGKVFFTNGEGVRQRCQNCFADELFLYRVRMAGLDENKVDLKMVSSLRDYFTRPLVLAIAESNISDKQKWAHSAAFLATIAGVPTAIYSDNDIVEAVFRRGVYKDGASWMDNFMRPGFLVLNIAETRNTKILSPSILHVVWDREKAKKATLLLFDSVSSFKTYYDKEEKVSDFIMNDLYLRVPKAFWESKGDKKNE